MIEQIPAFVPVVFLITTFITILIFLYAVLKFASASFAAKLLIFLVPFWMLFQLAISSGTFYQQSDAIPPRLFAFGVAPALVLILALMIFARGSLIDRLPLAILTLIHSIRVPIELVLHWLADAGVIPTIMTYEGQNFDILSGITAPFVYYFGLRGKSANRTLLIVWNLAALGLLINIVTTAILAFPSPFQSVALDQPNRAVMFFPYVWLPTIVVPIVLFCHLASLYKLFAGKTA